MRKGGAQVIHQKEGETPGQRRMGISPEKKPPSERRGGKNQRGQNEKKEGSNQRKKKEKKSNSVSSSEKSG